MPPRALPLPFAGPASGGPGLARALTGGALRADARKASLRAQIAGVKNRPGVYRMVGEDGGVLYVGKSKQLRTRLLSYFRCEPPEKGARILQETARIEWDDLPSEFSALLVELRLIKRYRPRYNVAGKRDARHYAFIRLSRGPAPKLSVLRGSSGDAKSLYYGPFFSASRLGEAVRALSDVFGLRDCSDDVPLVFAEQTDLFATRRTPGCLRYEIKRCLGPCTGAPTRLDYAARVGDARAFLEGRGEGPLLALREEMFSASARLEFERAAVLRGRLERLSSLREQFQSLRFALETLTFVYPVAGHGGDDRIYLVRRGSVRAERPAPKTSAERRDLERLAAEVFGATEPPGAPVPVHELDEVRLLSAWFRRYPGELARASVPPLP